MKIRCVTTEMVLLDFVGFSKLKDEEQFLNRVAMLPPPPRHLTEAQIAELDEYLENLRAGSPADVDAVGPITKGQDAAHP